MDIVTSANENDKLVVTSAISDVVAEDTTTCSSTENGGNRNSQSPLLKATAAAGVIQKRVSHPTLLSTLHYFVYLHTFLFFTGKDLTLSIIEH